MTLSYSSFPNNKRRSALLLSKMSQDLKSLKLMNDSNSFYSPKNSYLTPKKNELLISNLCNSSKKLIKNSIRYKSYFSLPKYYNHIYPYKPNSTKANANSISSFDTNNSIKKEKKIKIFKIKENSKFLQRLKKFDFIVNKSKVNEEIFFDYIDRNNINSKIKTEYNNYTKVHQINRDINSNIYKLLNILKEYKLEENHFFDKKYYTKINEFKTKNGLLIKLKISSLKILFYKSNNNNTNNKDLNSKINFPFEFLSFFYGLSLYDILKFFLEVIIYDYSKEKFFFDFKKFFLLFNEFKNNPNFFDENCFFSNFYEKNIEFFEYNWDVKNNEKIENYLMKIFLPKIIIKLENKAKEINIKRFEYSLEIFKMIHLMKEKFHLWDFYILNYFSEYKLFRQEVNNFLSNKFSYIFNGFLFKRRKNFILNNGIIDNNNNKNIKIINFNKISDSFRANKNKKNYEFFYTDKLPNNNIISYFFEIKIPKIHINYKHNNDCIEKNFDLNMERMKQINKLKKSFNPEDIIKFSMDIIPKKKDEKKKILSGNSFFEINNYRKIKRSITILSDCKKIRKNKRTYSSRLMELNVQKNYNKKKTTIVHNFPENENKKDIKLNLDKYIFNFDEDLLKFIIRPNEEEKNVDINLLQKSSKSNKNIKLVLQKKIGNNIDKNKNLNIIFGKMKLRWIENDLKTNEYSFDDNEYQYLLENSEIIWREYIEKNIDVFKIKINKQLK